MRGAGIRTAITTARSFPVLLDITRLTSRVGRGPQTGIDRVELAYLNWCLNSTPDVWGLAKIAGGYVLLDRAGMQQFQARIAGLEPWGPRDLRAMVGLKTSAQRGAAEADLRRLAVRRGQISDLKSHFETLGARGFAYLNVGHSNLSPPLLGVLHGHQIKVVTFLHDLIPLEFPHYQRGGSVPAFQVKLKAAFAHSDLVITNSKLSANQIRAEASRHNYTPPVAYAYLGIESNRVTPKEQAPNRPYFTVIGTIEPRKNHGFLLDIWQDIAAEYPKADIPDLHIIGQRGWVNTDVITRLDALKHSPHIHEHKAMHDEALWSLLANAHGLLFPSFAEGFGLPSLEAASLGTPIICGDLAIHRELLGDYPVYASLQDRYHWKKNDNRAIWNRADSPSQKDARHIGRRYRPGTCILNALTMR